MGGIFKEMLGCADLSTHFVNVGLGIKDIDAVNNNASFISNIQIIKTSDERTFAGSWRPQNNNDFSWIDSSCYINQGFNLGWMAYKGFGNIFNINHTAS